MPFADGTADAQQPGRVGQIHVLISVEIARAYRRARSRDRRGGAAEVREQVSRILDHTVNHVQLRI